jgi:hypothetical protein
METTSSSDQFWVAMALNSIYICRLRATHGLGTISIQRATPTAIKPPKDGVKALLNQKGIFIPHLSGEQAPFGLI